MRLNDRKNIVAALRAAATALTANDRLSDRKPAGGSGNALFDQIKSGSRVTIRTPQGQERRGKAVMYNRQHNIWVLNMGGPSGTPGEANVRNVVKVSGSATKTSAGSGGYTTVLVKELPLPVQKALKSVGYRRRDIEIKSATTFSRQSYANDGMRAYNTFVNLYTGRFETEYGSWGGANIFEEKGPDRDSRERPLPEGVVHIKGTSGGRGNFAWIYANPKTITPLLPATTDLSEDELKALEALRYKASYRADHFRENGLGRYNMDNPLIQSLLAKKMLQVNSAGAISITTAGKNARS